MSDGSLPDPLRSDETLDLLVASHLLRSEDPTETTVSLVDIIWYLAGALPTFETARLLSKASACEETRIRLRGVKNRMDALKALDWDSVVALSTEDPVAAAWVELCRETATAGLPAHDNVKALDWSNLRSLAQAGGKKALAALAEMAALAEQLTADLRQPRIAFSRGNSGPEESSGSVVLAEITAGGALRAHLRNPAPGAERRFLCLRLAGHTRLLAAIPEGSEASDNLVVVVPGFGTDLGLSAGQVPAECFSLERVPPETFRVGRFWVREAFPEGQVEVRDLVLKAGAVHLRIRIDQSLFEAWAGGELVIEQPVSFGIAQRIVSVPLATWRIEERSLTIPFAGCDLADGIPNLQFRLLRET